MLHDQHLRIWALRKEEKENQIGFKVWQSWITEFKKANRISSRKITEVFNCCEAFKNMLILQKEFDNILEYDLKKN